MPRTIGHYEITGTLGEGGMGIAYAARDARLNRSVALKACSDILRFAETRYREAAAAFVAAGGERILGPLR